MSYNYNIPKEYKNTPLKKKTVIKDHKQAFLGNKTLDTKNAVMTVFVGFI